MKPAPADIQDQYLSSLETLGLKKADHDIRFVQDDWESPSLGAWGLGWEVRLDGMEITQFTYFQEIGGIALDPISVELTYGLERIAMYLQQVDNVFDLHWSDDILYRDIHHETEVEFSRYNFEQAHVETLLLFFEQHEQEAKRLLEDDLVLPAYDQCIKTSHYFNVLDARGAISATERATYIARVRALARLCAEGWVRHRETQRYPLRRRAPRVHTPVRS